MEKKQYYSDMLHCLLRCFVFQSPIHNRWAVQYGTILIWEAYIDSNTVCLIRYYAPPAMGEGIKRCRDPSVRLSVPCGRQGLLGAQRHHQAARAVQTADPSMHRQFGSTYFMSSISH